MRESISWYVAGSARRFSVIGVTIGPGCTEFARMPSFAYWIAVTFVNSRTAPLEAGYIGLVMSVPTSPSCDEMLTIEPPPARRMAGMAALLPRNTPVALTSITRCHASSGVSSTRPVALMPALLTSTLSLPKRCSASATASCQSFSRVTSSRTKAASPPLAATSASTARPSASSTSAMTTCAPSRANILASAAPMPRAAPLISATFPASLMSPPFAGHVWPGVLSYRRNVRRKDTTMANPSRPSHVYVGVGSFTSGKRPGIFRRVGEGGWEQLTKGLPEGTKVQAITVDPTNPDIIYIGTHDGPYRSKNGGDAWERLALPESGLQVWSVLVHPGNPRRIYAGTSPVGVFRSDDGGDTWRRLPKAILPERVKMGFACRVMRLAADPARPETIWAGLEVGGIMKTEDGGETWTDCTADLVRLAEQPHLKSRIVSDTEIEGMLDIHAVALTAARPGVPYAAIRMGLFQSTDGGARWRDMEVGRFSPLTYGRDIRVSPQDSRVMYACLSPAARSQDGSLYRSDDVGETWKRFDHGVKAETTMMAVALHPTDADRVYCVSRTGQVFGTEDGGRSWREHRLPEGVEDIYALACA